MKELIKRCTSTAWHNESCNKNKGWTNVCVQNVIKSNKHLYRHKFMTKFVNNAFMKR